MHTPDNPGMDRSMNWWQSWKSRFHLWLGHKDFWSGHKHLDKSGQTVSLVIVNNDGRAVSVHTSLPETVEEVLKLMGTAMTREEDET